MTFVYAADVNSQKNKIQTMFTAGNLAGMVPPASITLPLNVAKSEVIKRSDFQKLADSINVLESKFSNNCNCMQNTNKCQSCQSMTQSCQACQSCQGLTNCNCGSDGV